jgi:uncharacterized protein (DUF427 family)
VDRTVRSGLRQERHMPRAILEGEVIADADETVVVEP